ncbi:MAG: hypothetical protein AMXMBFR13_06200 [Phycisphaerae bacterium]
MAEEEVIFSGSGGDTPALLMWDDPNSGDACVRVSAFAPGYSIYALAVSPNGTRLASGTRAGLLRVYHLERHRSSVNAPAIFEVFHGKNLETGVLGLAFLTDETLASAGEDGRIKVWDITRRQQLAEFDAHAAGVVALCPLGSLVLASVGMDGVLRVWDLDSLEAKYESEPFLLPRISGLTALDFDPSTGFLLHASRDGQLHAYDTRNGFSKRLVPSHQGDFCAVACGAEMVATAGLEDLTLKLWPRTLDEPIRQGSVAVPIVALGWVGATSVMAILKDGSAQFWREDGDLQIVGRSADHGLRTCAGLPPTLVAKSRIRSRQQWRDARISEANELMRPGDPESRRRLMDLIDELRSHGFSAEASLLLADAAKSDGKLLWELESRLRLVEAFGDDPAVVPSLYAIGELLDKMKEPALAVSYLERVLKLEEDHRDTRELIARLQSHPWMSIRPETCARGDLGSGQLICQEIDKCAILQQKFCWRVVFDILPVGTETTRFSFEELIESIRDKLALQPLAAGEPGMVRTVLVSDREKRNVCWLFVPHADPNTGLAYALEVQPFGPGSRITVCGLFDAGLLRMPEAAQVDDHNRQVKEAWERLSESSAAKSWLAEIHDVVVKGMRRVAANRDREW